MFGSIGIGVELTQVSQEARCWRLGIGVCGAERAEQISQRWAQEAQNTLIR